MAYTKIVVLTLALATLASALPGGVYLGHHGYQLGVLAPGQDTPEVQIARINHLKAFAQVQARNNVAALNPLAVNPYSADSLAGLTPAVAHARIAHYNDVARATARNSLGAAASLVVDPNENTPEVTLSRIAHLKTLANEGARNAVLQSQAYGVAPLGIGAYGGLGWSG